MFIKDVFITVLSPDTPQASSSPKSLPKSNTSKLAGLLHGRRPSRSALSSASQAAVNSLSSNMAKGANGKPLPSTPASPPPVPSRMSSTIRRVQSFEDQDRSSEDSGSDSTPSLDASHTSAFSSSINSNASGTSTMSKQPSQQPPRNPAENNTASTRLKQSHSVAVLDPPAPTLAVPGLLSQRQSVEMSRSSFEIPQRDSSLTAVTSNTDAELPPPPPPPPGGGPHEIPLAATTDTHLPSSNGWDSTIGKAGLGKTGRVINKLVSDNEALKRDIQIERLRAEESKQAARLLEDKMDRLVSEYESRLLEANVTKALLARKERQVETLQATVELERRRAADAGDRERVWKDEMEKVRAEAKQQVEEATGHAGMMEGRYNAISSHWRDQGDEVRKAVARMRGEIGELLEERKKDDDRIGTLRELCDQQDGNIRDLRRQKEEIAAQFEKYKAEQDDALRDIKSKAAQREEEQERTLGESREVLNKLRWALSVKDNVEWAQ